MQDFVEMQASQQAEVTDLITAAMNADEGKWAQQTFDFHFACLEKGMDSSRQFYIARSGEVIAGVVGLHQYRWGPAENVWLSWFAVRPDYQGQGVGKWLLTEILKTARDQGYRKMFIETYQAKTFSRAIEFYQRQGFRRVGSVEHFLPDNSDMLIFVRNID